MDKYWKTVQCLIDVLDLAEMNGLVYQGTLVSELLHEVRWDVEEFDLSKAAEKVEGIIGDGR